MLGFLGGIGAKVWGYIATAGAVLAAIAVIFSRGKRAGQNEVTAGVNGATAAAGQRMGQAAVQAPSRVSPVAADMEKGKF